eukprot:s4736_g6.t1
MPPVTARLLSDAHVNTWYTVSASDAIQQTARGSRPGSPLADVAFNALMTRLIPDLQRSLHRHPQLQEAFAMLGLTAPIVAWVDDLAVPVVVSKAVDLTSVSVWVLQEVIRISGTYGLVLNLQPTKTEAVIAFRGVNALQCRKECYDDHQGHMISPDADVRLRCVPIYEHLGTYFTADGGIDAELRHRTARATQAHRQVRKAILHNRHLSSMTRLKLFEALIVPILLHGAGNWPLLNQPQMTKLQGVYIKWIRAIVGNGCWTPEMMNDQTLLCCWQLPSMPLRLAKLRLLYAFHWEQHCPLPIVDMIMATSAQTRSWFLALRHAMSWLQTMMPELFACDPRSTSSEAILAWLRLHREDGPRLVRRVYRRAVHQGHLVGRVVQAHHQLRSCFGSPMCTSSSSPTTQLSCRHAHECRLCAKTFSTLTALHTHQWLAHEVISDERKMMDSTTCGACHKCFWTSQRLQQHLRYSRRHAEGCYAQLTWRRAPHLAAPDIDEDRFCQRFHRRPAVRVPRAIDRWADQICSSADAMRWFEQYWDAESFPSELDGLLATRLHEQFDEAVLSWPSPCLADIDSLVFQLLSLAEGAEIEPSHGDQGEWALCSWIMDKLRFSKFMCLSPEVFQRLDHDLQSFLRTSTIGKLLCWRRRMDEAHQPLVALDHELPVTSSATSVKDLETIHDPCAQQLNMLAPLFVHPVPRPSSVGVPLGCEGGKPVIWLLHMFSGRRRRGDCHWWLTHIGEKVLPGFSIRMISVDTAIDAVHGDLSQGRNPDLILRMAKRGLFAASLTGPPCETFSAARGLQAGEVDGPRPLRSIQFPWCLPVLSARELRQCDTGSELLLNSLSIEVSIVAASGGALMEHPEEPVAEDKISVWRLAFHREWCMALRDACRHHFNQWLYGAAGVKPTCLRALNLGPPDVIGRS